MQLVSYSKSIMLPFCLIVIAQSNFPFESLNNSYDLISLSFLSGNHFACETKSFITDCANLAVVLYFWSTTVFLV